MSEIAKLTLIGAAVLAAATPVSAESWGRFSSSDRTAYLVDAETLTAVDGVTSIRFARVPTHGAADDQSHDVEEVLMRCADGQSRTTTTITLGPDGAETDRISEEAPWDATPDSGVYGMIKSFACEDMRPSGKTWPTIAAFIAEGRK